MVKQSEENTTPLTSSWVDETEPLPADVTFLPLQTKSFAALLPWSLLALFFFTWVVLPLIVVGRAFFTQEAGLVAYFLFGAVAMMVMFSVFLYGILSFLIAEYRWWWAAGRGRLRHGIFLGPQHLLVRVRREEFALERGEIQAVKVIERKRGQRFDDLVEIELKKGEPIQFLPETEIPADQLTQHIRRWLQ